MNNGCTNSKARQRMVDAHVLARGGLPRVVNAHPVQLNPSPSGGLRVPVERLARLVNEGLRRVRAELEARALARRRVELLDRVVKSARGAHQGNCAVAHRVHLVQTARLVERGHQEEVRARLDLVRGRRVETFVDGDAVRREVLERLQKIFVLALARTERDKEGPGFENLTGDLLDEVVALLRDEPRDGRDDGAVKLFGQTESSQEVELAGALSRQVVRREVRGCVSVRFGVPNVVVNSVRDADEAFAPLPKEPVESVPLLRRLNLE